MRKRIILLVVAALLLSCCQAGAKELDKRSGPMLNASLTEYCGFDLVDKSKNNKGIDILVYSKRVAGGESTILAALDGTCLTHVSILTSHDFPNETLLASIQLAFYNLALAINGEAFVCDLKTSDDQKKINDSVIKLWEEIIEGWKKDGKNSFSYDYGIKVDTSMTKKLKYVTLSLPDR